MKIPLVCVLHYVFLRDVEEEFLLLTYYGI